MLLINRMFSCISVDVNVVLSFYRSWCERVLTSMCSQMLLATQVVTFSSEMCQKAIHSAILTQIYCCFVLFQHSNLQFLGQNIFKWVKTQTVRYTNGITALSSQWKRHCAVRDKYFLHIYNT